MLLIVITAFGGAVLAIIFGFLVVYRIGWRNGHEHAERMAPATNYLRGVAYGRPANGGARIYE